MARSTSRALLTLAAAALLSSACAQPEEAVMVEALVLRPLDSTFVVGRASPLSVRARLTDGSERLASRDAAWTSSNPAVIELRRDESGTVAIARAAGHAELTAEFQGITATMSAQVGERIVDALVLEAIDGQRTLPRGRTFQLRAVATWSDAETQDVTASAGWTAVESATLELTDVSGSVRAAGEGAGAVRAEFGGRTAELTLEVTAPVMDRLEIDPPVASLAHGTELQLVATAIFSDGETRDVTAEAAWRARDEAVVAIAAGALSGEAVGATEIEAELAELRATVPVTVTSAKLVEVQIVGGPASLPKGVTAQLELIGTFSDGSTQKLTGQAQWTSSDEGVVGAATSGIPGAFIAASVGVAEISAEFGGLANSRIVEVTPAALATLTVSPATAEVPLGVSAAAVASGVFTDGSVLDLTSQVSWSSTSDSVATVDEKGSLVPVAVGSTTVLASYQGQVAAVLVHVKPAVLVSIQVLGAPNAAVAKGTSVQLTAQGIYGDGHVEDVSANVLWTSVHGTVAAVSNAASTRGTVTGLSEGTTQVTASLGSVNGSVAVEVGPAVLNSVELDLGGASMPKGTTRGARATAVYSDGTRVEVSRFATWSSSDAAIAQVDADGTVTGVSEGAATISVSYGTFSAAAWVTVTPPVVTQVSPGAAEVVLSAGQSMPVSAYATLSDGTTVDVSQVAVWTSSSSAVATVSTQPNASPVLAAHSAGVAWVEVRYDGIASRIVVTVE